VQRLEVSGVVRLKYRSLGVKELITDMQIDCVDVRFWIRK